MMLEDMTMYCTICGGPILEPGVNCPAEWLGCAILLGTKDNQLGGLDIIEIPATNLRGPYFEVHDTKQRITACDIASLKGFVNPKPPLYIPAHAACIQIADQFALQDEGYGPNSLSHIWRVLKARFRMACSDRYCVVTPTKLHESHSYYGELWRFQEMGWEPDDDEGSPYEAQHFEADPVLIPSMTESILSHLTPIHKEWQHSTLISSSEAPPLSLPYLPPEIIHRIMEQLHPFSDPPLSCNFLISPSYWRQALINGVILPWLWDLDPRAVMRKEAELRGGDEWNWELLVRQLAQVTLYEPGKVLKDLPLGLRNRRRIWRLVGDIMATDAEA